MGLTWDEVEAATTGELLAWATAEPWGRAMAACEQDRGWHAEGDVWTHTALVVGELERADGWADLDRRTQLVLAFTALFHDSGKPATTVVDDAGRTRSPRHALVGTGLARELLRGLGSPLAFREQVAGLVRWHGRPAFLLEKPDPAREVATLSWLAGNRLLHRFAVADTRGRVTADTAAAEERLELFRLQAEDYDCLDRPFRFASDHARFRFFRDQAATVHHAPPDRPRCNVTLMCGLPGAGKDTWLRTHRPELPVVALDDVRAELGVDPTDDQGTVVQTAKERCRVHLRAGEDFAFNATGTVRHTRSRWIDLFADYAARVEVVYLEPPLATLRRQNRQRERPVPERVMDRLLARLEPPTADECHRLRLYDGTLSVSDGVASLGE